MSGFDGRGAGDEAGLELLDQVVLDATDEADRAGLGLERSSGADQERALLLGEHQRRHVGQVDDGVDDREARVGIGGGHRGDRVTEEEADADDEAGAFVDEALDALGAVAVTGRGRLEAARRRIRRRPGRDRRRRRR